MDSDGQWRNLCTQANIYAYLYGTKKALIMYLITGAAGFIGSCLVQYLNEQGIDDLLLVDDFVQYEDKTPNFLPKKYQQKLERTTLLKQLSQDSLPPLKAVFHLGARTDTTETDWAIFEELNLTYSKALYHYCCQRQIPLIYASSAATYGDGKLGYSDQHALVAQLQPLNPYGRSKNDFDRWVLTQNTQPPAWYGLKFFNVYGPNEYHKGRMASVIFHTFRQIKAKGYMQLFRSHRSEVADGEQQRDFVYVKDLCQVMYWLATEQPSEHGLYNMGTGQARTFLDLARLTFLAQELSPDIRFVDTPLDIRHTYQYFTEADMTKLRVAGYTAPFHSLEEGVKEYVQTYLLKDAYW